MRDAIVISGWTWKENNTPERLALSLAQAGATVLYVESPISFLKYRNSRASDPAVAGVHRLRPFFAAHRIFQMRFLSRAQTAMVAGQITRAAGRLKLRNPICFFPHGEESFLIASAMKRAGCALVHLEMDYELPASLPHAEVADLTLAIPEAAYSDLQRWVPNKVFRMPQIFSGLQSPAAAGGGDDAVSMLIASLPKPYLLYLGALQQRINRQLVAQMLSSHPDWHLVSFGSGDLHLPNHHVLPWLSGEQMAALLGPGAIGFMPYRLDDMKNLHCVPLKLFDYFSAGMAVVATPISYLDGISGLVYIARTPGELEQAIQRAMEEPAASPLKQQRRAFAERHSIESSALFIAPLLEDSDQFPPSAWPEAVAARHGDCITGFRANLAGEASAVELR